MTLNTPTGGKEDLKSRINGLTPDQKDELLEILKQDQKEREEATLGDKEDLDINDEKSLETLHDELDKKICEKVYEKTKNCKWDRNSISNSLELWLLKNSSLRPVWVKNYANSYEWGWIDFYFDSKIGNKNSKWNKTGFIIVTIKLKPTSDRNGNFETYLGYWEENIGFDSQWSRNSKEHRQLDRPVCIRHTDNEMHYDSKIKSKELLEEKIKFYESL